MGWGIDDPHLGGKSHLMHDQLRGQLHNPVKFKIRNFRNVKMHKGRNDSLEDRQNMLYI